MPTREIDVVVCGHLCLDIIPEMANVSLLQLPTPGRLFEVGPVTIATGGAVSNTGLTLHRLGARVSLVSNVGDDLVSNLILDYLRGHSEALIETVTRRSGTASSYTIVLSPERSDRIFLHCTGTNADFGYEHIDFSHVERCKVFHLGYPPILPRMYAEDGDELVQILQAAKRAGAITSLDMSLPDSGGPAGAANWEAIIRKALPWVDIFVPSIDEILFMLRREQYLSWDGRCAEHVSFSLLQEVSEQLLAWGAAITGFKLGDYGFYLRAGGNARLSQLPEFTGLTAWSDKEAWHPAFMVDVAGTTGAGDSAYAGLLVSMLHNDSIEDAARFASAVGAHNVERPDATSGIPSADMVRSRLLPNWSTLNKRPG